MIESYTLDNKDALDDSAEWRKWLDKVKAREKIFKDGWWKAAEKASDLYNNEKEDPQNPYNILYSNTEVLKPSLYSATPKPDIRGRFVENPVSPLTKLVENFLIVFSDPSNPGEESFDSAMSEAVTSGLVTGLGFIRLRVYQEKAFPICPEAGHFKGLIWAAGRKWHKLPWIAFRHEMTKEEIFSQFKTPAEDRMKFKVAEAEDEESALPNAEKKFSSIVYELWDKAARKVYFLCEDWEPLLLGEDEDTLQLQGFYPTPGPLLFTQKPGRLLPTPLYEYYRNQAEELNRVTARLNKILAAIKVRGTYNNLLGDELKALLSDDTTENALVPAREAGVLLQTGGLDKQIWFLPLEKLIEVATQLYQARLQIKQVIYEITGLSDIIRGSSVASETATAQNLKNKWGSIRLRDMQKTTAGYVRDIYRLCVDAAVTIVPESAWKAITQAPLPTSEEKAAAAQLLQQIMPQIQQAMQQAQMMGQQPPPPPPQVMQAMETAKSPSIGELLSQIKSDANRAFIINVQSDSTVDIDTATDKQEVSEYMNSMGQLLAGLQPLAALGPTGMEASKAILIAVSSRFKFGLSILDSLRNLQAPPPEAQGPTPEQEKADKELEAKQKELESKENELKTLLEQIQDAQRALETSRKEFQADVKVVRAEMSADQAKEQAAQVQRESSLKTLAVKATQGNRPTGKSGGNSPAPAPDNSAQALTLVSSVLTEMQKVLKTLSAPRIAQKDPETGVWSSAIIPQEDSSTPEPSSDPMQNLAQAVSAMKKAAELVSAPRTTVKDPSTGIWASIPQMKQ